MALDDSLGSGDLAGEFESLITAVRELEAHGKQLRRDFNSCYSDQESLLKDVVKCRKTTTQLTKALKAKDTNTEERTKYTGMLEEANRTILDLKQQYMPATGSLFVRLFLGHVNVKVIKSGEKFIMKKEYEKFKGRTNIVMIVGALMQLFEYPGLSWVKASFQVWLLYYYISLALREHILKVNGSLIKWWWIAHHYLSIAVSLLLLTWPGTPSNKLFTLQLVFCVLCQGTVQLLMHRYQVGRLYLSVATGESKKIDITGELSAPRFVPSLSVLLPFLLFVQCFQIFNAYSLIRYYCLNNVEVHVLLLGLFLTLIGVGNLSTTVYTYYEKWRYPRHKKQE